MTELSAPAAGGDTSPLGPALVEEATKKSGLVWVRGEGPERALWHLWHEGAMYLIGDGGDEQPLPGLTDGGTAEVTVRSKDKGGRLIAWAASVREVEPRSELWETVAPELKGKRLNAVDSDGVLDRWARDCRLLCLTPVSSTTDLPDGSLAAAPADSPVTTRRPAPAALPRLLLGRKRKRG
ncbi:hypothetical protein [Streptomyces sp. CAU 1734]|uniref:hypothetical protein n=1 Tax=Streptomyces sp. CAU 1734 TaxID=3140360 RepID=UPI003260516C